MPILAVAPHWGAWIEIQDRLPTRAEHEQSHPTGVRGLKYAVEIQREHAQQRRTPLGCVD